MATLRDTVSVDRPVLGVRIRPLGARGEDVRATPEGAAPDPRGKNTGSPPAETAGEPSELDLLLARAREEGRLEALTPEIERLLQALSTGVERLKEAEARVRSEAHAVAAELAFAVAERVVARALDRKQYDVPNLVAECLERITEGRHGEVIVRLHPEDYRTMEELMAHPALAAWRDLAIQVEPDPDLDPAGCRVEAGQQEIATDARGRLSRLGRAIAPGTPRSRAPRSQPLA